MKTQIKAKFLRYILNKKQEEQGFTLIELLVVIIIIGILSAIALPSFLNQANKAKQTEGKTYVGSMNRAQQTYYLENGKFASNDEFDNLGLGIATTTTNYNYAILPATGATTTVTNQARPRTDGIKAYIGGVKLGNVTRTNEATTVAVLCEAKLGKDINNDKAAKGTEVAEFGTPSGSGTPPSCPTATYNNLSNNTSASSQSDQTSSSAPAGGG
ncbi:MAG: prepilin-type N-terminal cleavage/methylation domain-containing protein [Scytonema hyalinum WJT4-NPBG1]|jgi:prepilin-type N-terminal cleavage/methylation domain-containing protein|nr:prepilin-type N-terminal cleavage/methylation domain-containing protein [Scytonema hyalinum WJT4-NPBG1]